MGRWISLLLSGMMRFGCGRNMAYRNHDGKEKHKC